MVNSTLQAFVDLALPKPCQFGLENFAGDPIALRFCEWLLKKHEVNVTFFVSWECPPDTLVVRTAAGAAVVRSERLDTLLVEYHNLSQWHQESQPEIAGAIMSSTLLRWGCEFLLAYRSPALAIHATLMRPSQSGVRLHSPFRDETLASIDDLPRSALQCFALAHEVGHIVMPARTDTSLDFYVDRTSLADHIRWSDRETVLQPEQLSALEQIWTEKLNAANLVSEVDADLFAFWVVVDFIANQLGFDIEDAIRATLQALEAQLFICAWKNSCRFIAKANLRNESESTFSEIEYLIGAEYVARSRVIVRRAGITWALAENTGASFDAIDFDSYARRVDQMLTPTIGFRSELFGLLQVHSLALFQFATEMTNDARVHPHSYIDLLERDVDLKLELFYTLISFGCDGSVNVADYLRAIASHSSQ